jgi:hypothetical protein
MYDPKAPSSVLALAEYKKPLVQRLLTKLAWQRAKHEQDAEDLLSNSLIRVLDPDDLPWVPTARPFVFHMRVVMRRVWQGHQALLRTKNEVYDGGATEENAADDGAGPDEAVARARELETERILGERLRTRLVDDPDALRLFDFASTQDLERGEQAAALGWTTDQWRAVYKRIAYAAKAVRQEWLDGEERRMNALRRGPAMNEGDAP